MGTELVWSDRYAGDDAWAEWFEICSVAGCRPEYAARLRGQVSSAMYSHLARAGVPRGDAGDDDPVAFFDSYFALHGSRDARKPLKSYFAHRIRDEGMSMSDFVCGTLFGSASGRVRDIVLEWVAALKGWKPRTVSGDDGRRRLVWENAVDADLSSFEDESGTDGAEYLDEEPLRAEASRVLDAVARRARVERPAAALLVFATSHDVPLTEPCVLSALGTGKSQAYAWRDKAMRALERELRSAEAGETPLFARLLVSVAADCLSSALRRELGVDA